MASNRDSSDEDDIPLAQIRSTDATEVLILAVEQYPALFDKANVRYYDASFKRSKWTKIGKRLNITGNFYYYVRLYIYV